MRVISKKDLNTQKLKVNIITSTGLKYDFQIANLANSNDIKVNEVGTS